MRRVGQSGPADAVAAERAEGTGKAIPVDQASEPHQRMLRIDQVHERRAEEFGLLGRRRFGRLRRASARRRGDGLTPLGSHQPGWDFAGFSPVADRNLANANTCRSQKAKAFRGVRRFSRATTYTIVWSLARSIVIGTGHCVVLAPVISQLTVLRYPLIAPLIIAGDLLRRVPGHAQPE
jgi:hypothetical protein